MPRGFEHSMILIFGGIALLLAGLISWGSQKFGIKLPGDLVLQIGGTSFHFPIMSGFIAGFITSLLFHILRK